MDSDNRNSGAHSPPLVGSYVAGLPDRPATWEDIVNLPEHFGAEIVGGRIHYRAMTRWQHAESLGDLCTNLRSRFARRSAGGWWILPEADFDIGHGSSVRPDLAGIRKERYQEELPDELPLQLIPDWVCEVLSPSNAHYDRGDKAEAYAKAGVPWYWIVDTEERTLEVLELVNGRWQIFGVYTDGAAVALPPFGEVPLAVSEIFVPKKAPAEP